MAGEDEIAADVGEGLEHEPALGPARVGDDEAAAADGLAVVVDQIDVDRARDVGPDAALAPEGQLDFLDLGEELVGVQRGPDDQHGVVERQVGEFFGYADGFGFVDGSGGEQGDFGNRGDGGAGGLEAGEPVVEIGAEAESCFDAVHGAGAVRPRTSRMP